MASGDERRSNTRTNELSRGVSCRTDRPRLRNPEQHAGLVGIRRDDGRQGSSFSRRAFKEPSSINRDRLTRATPDR